MDENQRERYVRWQDYRITQMSFAINLFLGFAVASLAFAINLKLKPALPIELPFDCTIVYWAVSALLGCLATIIRLLDFRYTAKKIKHGGKLNSFMASICGSITWVMLWGQVISYAAGALIFVLATIGI